MHSIALLPWGDLIEDYLDPIGLSLEDFAKRMSGGWLFGYIEALKLNGVETTVVCISRQVSEPRILTHNSTGAVICALPPPRIYLWLRARAQSKGFAARIAHHLAPYFSTPVRRLIAHLRQSGCRALLCQEYENPRFDVAVLVSRYLRIPVFATFQGGVSQRSLFERWIRPLSMRMSAGLVIAPGMERERVRRRYRKLNTKICPALNPLDTSLWYPEDKQDARKKLGLPPEARIAIWHGRIDVDQKGLDILIEAWRQLYVNHPETNLRLILVGGGKDGPTLEAMLSYPEIHGVIWRNEYLLDRGTMRTYLSAADVYVFCSRREGFAVAPMEAMACGLPVVGAAIQGMAEIIRNSGGPAGVLVRPEDAAAIARETERLLTDPALCREMGAAARKRADTLFSLRAAGDRLSAFFFSNQS